MTITMNRAGRRRRTTAVAALALLAPIVLTSTSTSSNAAQQPEPLGTALQPAPAGAASSLPVPTDIVRSRLAQVAVQPQDLGVGDRVVFNPFDQVNLTGTVTSADVVASGPLASRSVSGTLSDGGTFQMVQAGDAQRYSVNAADAHYSVNNNTDDSAALVVEYKPSSGPVDDGGHETDGDQPQAAPQPDAVAVEREPVAVESPVDGPVVSSRKADVQPTFAPATMWTSHTGRVSSYNAMYNMRYPLPAGDLATYVDDWILFSPQAFASLGGTESQAVAYAKTMELQANTLMANSQIPTRIRVVRVSLTNVPQKATILDEITALNNYSDGYLDTINTARRAAKIDHVTQVIKLAASDPACGRGTLGGTDYRSFTVMGDECITGNGGITYGHELGHNFTAQHDRGASETPTPGNLYAFGYVDPAKKFRTVMSYPTTCPYPTCRVINQFSSATLKYNYNGTLLPTGNATTDNRRAVINYSRTLANVAPSKIYPGNIGVFGDSWRIYGIAGSALPWAATPSYSWYVGNKLVKRGRMYVPKASQNGKKLKLVVTYSTPGYSSVSRTTSSWKIMKVKGTRWSGRGKVGNTLRVYSGRKAIKGQKMSVVWKRGNKTVGKKSSYKLRRADAGHDIYALVTYRAGKKALGFTTSARWNFIWR